VPDARPRKRGILEPDEHEDRRGDNEGYEFAAAKTCQRIQENEFVAVICIRPDGRQHVLAHPRFQLGSEEARPWLMRKLFEAHELLTKGRRAMKWK